jgi:peptide-methionine (S)-S-oxide reductase
VIRTRVGYAGGRTIDPNYGNMGDHTETVQIDYDPQRISYADLLRIFWDSHHPGQHALKTQYMNAVFYHNEQQRQMGLETKAAIEKKTGRTVNTQVLPLRAFYIAEDYHQKYLLNRNSDIAKELMRIYPNKRDFVDSTAVARVNGYLGGNGDIDQLSGELGTLGLSRNRQQALAELVKGRWRGIFN